MWAVYKQDEENLLGTIYDDGSWDAIDADFPDIPDEVTYEPATGLPFQTRLGDAFFVAAVLNFLIDEGYEAIAYEEKDGKVDMMELAKPIVLDDSEAEDWPKARSWDFPAYDPAVFPFNQDAFKQSVSYKAAVIGGLIVDGKWQGRPEGYQPIPPPQAKLTFFGGMAFMAVGQPRDRTGKWIDTGAGAGSNPFSLDADEIDYDGLARSGRPPTEINDYIKEWERNHGIYNDSWKSNNRSQLVGEKTASPLEEAQRRYAVELAEQHGAPLRETKFVPGDGADQFQRITNYGEDGNDSIHTSFKGYSNGGYGEQTSVKTPDADHKIANYELKTGANGEWHPMFRAVYPDEPHSSRDGDWPHTYVGRPGQGGYVNTSPGNSSSISKEAFKFWETAGTVKGANAGSNPQCGIIREAADKHFAIPTHGDPRRSVLFPIDSNKADSLAKSMYQGIEKAQPAQPILWRGMGNAPELKSAKVGDTMHTSLMSTSRGAHAAKGYMGSSENGVMLRIAPGSRGVAIESGRYSHDQEVVSGGKFRIVGKSNLPGGQTVLDVEQIEVPAW